ncbi:MAG TPA: DUF3307 domain-containing protein [Tissierellia bacterium]|nr:DUF3307 domain-containing protein [Tissierellia bacterium]
MTLLLIFILTHLLTDFVLQTDRLVARKRTGERLAMIHHGLIHLVVGVILLALCGQLIVLNMLSLVLLSLGHVLLDMGKQRLKALLPRGETVVFLFDQALHLSLIFVLALLVQPIRWLLLSPTDRVLGILITIVFTLWSAGILIGCLLEDLRLREIEPGLLQTSRPAIGRYIGYLERGLIAFFLLSGSIASLALLATFKTLARFRQLDDQAFAEYYLLGTLLSLSFGIAGSFMLRIFI